MWAAEDSRPRLFRGQNLGKLGRLLDQKNVLYQCFPNIIAMSTNMRPRYIGALQ